MAFTEVSERDNKIHLPPLLDPYGLMIVVVFVVGESVLEGGGSADGGSALARSEGEVD